MNAARARRRRWWIPAVGLVGIFGVLQVIPVGGAPTNPLVIAEPSWDSAQTRDLFLRACGDCHSNQTRWPWYTHVAPLSWLVVRDVDEGRSHFNVSEWQQPQDDAEEAAQLLLEGEMPLRSYLLAHPEARLPPQDKLALARGLQATFGTENEGWEDEEDEDGEGDSGRHRRRRGREG
ncbi:MAG TPA: heme-binding domain-containing protein [Thermoanaerobaculia bacterium]|nr:heme-binding domain-containing protein [Thermoanaerobaculia bacterium]